MGGRERKQHAIAPGKVDSLDGLEIDRAQACAYGDRGRFRRHAAVAIVCGHGDFVYAVGAGGEGEVCSASFGNRGAVRGHVPRDGDFVLLALVRGLRMQIDRLSQPAPRGRVDERNRRRQIRHISQRQADIASQVVVNHGDQDCVFLAAIVRVVCVEVRLTEFGRSGRIAVAFGFPAIAPVDEQGERVLIAEILNDAGEGGG